MRQRVFLSLVGVMALGACSTPVATPVVTKTVSYPVPESSTPSFQAPSEMPVPEPQNSKHMGFGARYKFSDGLSVSISRPVEFTPSEGVDGAKSKSVKFVLTFSNSSSSPFDPSHVTMRVLSQGNEGVDLYDPANGLRGQWDTTPISAGRSRQYVAGFSVDGTEEVQVTILTSLDRYEAVTFTG